MMQTRKSPKLLLELYEHVHPDLSVNIVVTSFNFFALFLCLYTTSGFVA